MVSPVEVISATLAACTWVRKNVYDTDVRSGGASSTDEMIQLIASSTSSIHPKRNQAGRCLGGCGSCPWPGGAPSTRQGCGRSVGAGGCGASAGMSANV